VPDHETLIFEHAPTRTAHVPQPHGSAQNLLDTSMPMLCLSCHSTADTWHFEATGEPGLQPISSDDPRPPGERCQLITMFGAGAFYTRCTDCHGAIHGSYQDPHLRR
jgi:predicted CXXCH cytochrome family protein